MQKERKLPKERVHFYLDPPLMEWLRDRAVIANRPISRELEEILKQAANT